MADTYDYSYENSEVRKVSNATNSNSTSTSNHTVPHFKGNAANRPIGDYYGDYYRYEYYDYRGTDTFYYRGFDFERPVYLYAWIVLVLMTTIANAFVILVLIRRNMRNATNVILIAVAVSDSLTGLVTIPVIVYAYKHYEKGDLALTEAWCEAFMLVRYFVSRSFHTMSVWLTVVLGLQRVVSVLFPFRAQSAFTIRNTIVIIVIVNVLSPLLHIYHAFKKKAIQQDGLCEWRIETSCKETCVYLFLVAILMHFLPCVLLVAFTVTMVIMMHASTKKVRDSHMIANKSSLKRRDIESRQISCVVIAIVIVFLVPEIPYGVFLLITASLKHLGRELLDIKTNRSIICAYEILVLLGFQANFWIYLVMNRRFRHGLRRTSDPFISLINACLGSIGIKHHVPRMRSDSTSFTGRLENHSHTVHSHLPRLNSINSYVTAVHEPQSPTDSINSNVPIMEMKTYHFKFDTQCHTGQEENLKSSP